MTPDHSALIERLEGETVEVLYEYDDYGQPCYVSQPNPLCAEAAAALRDLTEWRDIETAPKDGAPIMAWCVHPHARHAADTKEWAAPVVTQWINHNGGGWTWNGMAGTFTHWLPLPAAHNQAKEAGE